MDDKPYHWRGSTYQMTPLQGRILYVLKRAGPDGLSGDDLFQLAYSDQYPRMWNHRGRSRTALKAKVWELNQTLRLTGQRVVGTRCPGGWYRLTGKRS